MNQLLIIALLLKCLIYSSAYMFAEVPFLEELHADYDGETVLNEMADKLVRTVTKAIYFGEFDPADCDEQYVDFQTTPDHKSDPTYSGTLILTNGFIEGLSSVSRRDNVLLFCIVTTDSCRMIMPLSFRDVVVGYNFELNVNGDTVSGVLLASVDEITADYVLAFSSLEMLETRHDFTLYVSSFKIDLQISDSDPYEGLLNKLAKDAMYKVAFTDTSAIVGTLLNEFLPYIARDEI